MLCVQDVRLYEAQGYGAEVNYRQAAPLLRDLETSLRAAADAGPAPFSSDIGGWWAGKSGGGAPRARLLFAHCETLVPLATLMGLFRPPPHELPEVPEDALAALDVSERQAR